MKFVDKIKNNSATMDDFESSIEEWHEANSGESVYDFLGITEDEYYMLLKHPEKIDTLKMKHKIASSFKGKVDLKYKKN